MADDPNILILPGVFDPPTLAHVDLIKAALRTCKTARLYIVPLTHPLTHAVPQIPAPVRLQLAKRAFEHLHPNIVVSELGMQERPMGMAQLVDSIKSAHPLSSLHLVMGIDQALRLTEQPHWHDFTRKAGLVIAPRPARVKDRVLLHHLGVLKRLNIPTRTLLLPARKAPFSAGSARVALQERDWNNLRRHVPGTIISQLSAYRAPAI